MCVLLCAALAMKRVAKQSIYIYCKDCLIDVNRRRLNGDLAQSDQNLGQSICQKGDFRRGNANNSQNPMNQQQQYNIVVVVIRL